VSTNSERTIFRAALVLDGQHPGVDGTSVVVEGNRITRVAPDSAVEAAPGDRIVDVAGRTLMPGMVQAHFHSHFGAFGDGVTAPSLGLEAAPPYLSMLAAHNAYTALQCGFTGAIGSSNAHAIDVSLKEAILAGFVEGPRYLAGSPEIVTTGEASDYDNNRNYFMELGNTGLTRKADGAEEWRHAVRVEAGRGADVIKISASPGHGSSPARDVMYLTHEELNACVEAAHTLGRKVRAHCASRSAILACARAGVDILDHADRLDTECIDALLEAGTIVAPSMLWTVRFLEIAENWDHAASPLPISEGFPESLEQTHARIRGVREDFEYTCQWMPEAARAGIPMVIGDDFGTPPMPHGDYAPEITFYVKQLGIAPLDVIRWATVNGYAAMGLGDEGGTIEQGRLADLLVIDGDPSADITCLGDRSRLDLVMKDGDLVLGDAA